MAKQDVTLEIKAKGDIAKKSVGEVKKALKETKDEADKVGQSMKGIGSEGVSVKQRLKQLKDEMANIGDIGSPRFQELAREAGKLKDQMNNANSAIKSMSSDFGNLQTGIGVLQGIGSAAQIAAGAQLLLGEENKELAKSLQRVMAITTMMSGVQSIANMLSDEHIVGQRMRLIQQKLLNKATVQQAVATGKATVMQRVMNAVMNANPIGIIITAIGLLITGFIMFRKQIVDFISNWDNLRLILLAMLGPIGWIIIAYEKLFSQEAKNARERERQEQIRREQLENELKDIDRKIAANKEAAEEFRKAKEKEIAVNEKKIQILENEGESSYALRLQVLEDNKAIMQSHLDEATEYIRLQREKWEARKTFSGLSEEAFRDQMKAQGVDLAMLEEESNKILEELQLDVQVAESEITKFKKAEYDKRAKEHQKHLDEEKRKEEQRLKEVEKRAEKEREINRRKAEELLKRRIAAGEKLKELQVKESGDELAMLEHEFQKKIEKLDEKIPEEHELILFYEEELRRKKLELQAKWDQEDEDQQKEKDNKEKARREKMFEDTIASTESVLSIANDLNTIFHGKEIKRIKEKEKAGLKLTAAEKKRLKREEKIQKAFAVAQIAKDTAIGIAGAVKAGAGIPFPGNIPAILSGVAAVLSGVKQAQAALGSDVDIPDANIADEATAASDEVGGQPEIPTQAAEFGNTLLNKVFVVESDITQTQNNVAVIESQATFG